MGEERKREADDRYERGLEKLKEVTGGKGERTIERLNTFAPELSRYIVEFAYGDIYMREGLALSQRMTVTLTALITLGDCSKELGVHVGSALRAGLAPREIMEIALHCAPYVGFPRVMNAMHVIKEAFAENGVPADAYLD